jgi:predicted phage baseplate assembly protein
MNDDDCGCCEGVGAEAPDPLDNPPGRAALSYRVGTHGSFLRAMMARLSERLAERATVGGDPAPKRGDGCLGETHRSFLLGGDPDAGTALLDGWACIADVLTFYQERIANEGYLRTATEQRSIIELGRLTGYEPRPGVAASVHLAFAVQDGFDGEIPAGTRTQSQPRPGQQAQVFEISDAINARAEWNAMRASSRASGRYIRREYALNDGIRLTGRIEIFLDGVGQNVQVGDILLVSDPLRSKRAGAEGVFPATKEDVYQVTNAWPDPDRAYARLRLVPLGKPWWTGGEWDYEDDGNNNLDPFAEPTRRTATASPALARRGLDRLASAVVRTRGDASIEEAGARSVEKAESLAPDTLLALAGSGMPELRDHLRALLRNAKPERPPQVYVLRTRAQIFGHAAPQITEVTLPPQREGGTSTSKSSDPPPAADESDNIVYLAGEQPGIRTDTPLVMRAPSKDKTFAVPAAPGASEQLARQISDGLDTSVFTVTAVGVQSRFAYGSPGKATRVLLSSGWWRPLREPPPPPPPPPPPSSPPAPVPLVAPAAPPPVEAPAVRRSAEAPAVSASAPAPEIASEAAPLAPSAAAPRPPIDTRPERVEAAPGGDTDIKPIRNTLVYAQPEPLALVAEPLEQPISGDKIDLDRVVEDLPADRLLIVEGERDAPGTTGIRVAELVRVGSSSTSFTSAPPPHVLTAPGATGRTVEHVPSNGEEPGQRGQPYTTIALTASLRYSYRRATVVIRGNVAHATHGETRDEILGSGDASQAEQRFTLRQGPRTWVSAPTPTGVASSLAVRVSGVLWPEVPSHSIPGPRDEVVRTRTLSDRRDEVRGGDGRRGARFPTGVENITARYRVGLGAAGNVDAGLVNALVTRPMGVREVVNPLRASGGTDPDGRDEIRQRIPIAARAIDRLVSVADHADFALNFAGVDKAAARQVPATSELGAGGATIEVVIAGDEDVPIEDDSDLLRNLRAAFGRYGDPLLRPVVRVATAVPLVLQAGVRIDPRYEWSRVEAALRERLYLRHGWEVRAIGEPARLSVVLEALQAVDGVRGIDVDVFGPLRKAAPPGMPPPPKPRPGPAGAGSLSESLKDQLMDRVSGLRERLAEGRAGVGAKRTWTFAAGPRELLYFARSAPDTVSFSEVAP